MKNYAKIANEVRLEVLDLIYTAQTSHIGSNLSCIDLLTVLYEKINLTKELKEDRDRVIFSKGWAAATAYSFLHKRGILGDAELSSYGKDNGLLGLVERRTRGIEASTGSMGHGLPIALGMALGAKRSGQNWHTYVLMSDGEMDCGTTWESALLAAHHGLNNLTVIVDYNKLQAMGRTEDVLSLKPLANKWQAFRWSVYEIKGHDYNEIEMALDFETDKPKIIIAHTIKGKGVSFMEDKLEWHYKNIDDESYGKAKAELANLV